jgi:hypothetical protein
MTESRLVQSLLRLRIAVGVLGEKSQQGWWPTSFFDSTSRVFLDPVFVRTALGAQYNGVTEAARRIHDTRLGVGSFHLFRMPEEVEQDLHAQVMEWARSGRGELPLDAPEATLAIEQFAAGEGTSSPGPRLLGLSSDLDKLALWQQAAAVYRDAFSTGFQSFPYFARK